MQSASNSSRSAWVQLYEARRVSSEPETRSVGRPPGIVPRHKVGLTLSQGEISEIEHWQERFSALLHRKVSAGETVGILTRICSSRFSRLDLDLSGAELSDLVEALIGAEE
jgi:hypothetical protein